MYTDIVIVLVCWLTILSGAIRDGMGQRYKAIGWLPYHIAIWAGRDLVVFVLFIYFALSGKPWHGITCLLPHVFHSFIYEWVRTNWTRFDSSQKPPQWYTNLRKLWSWMQV